MPEIATNKKYTITSPLLGPSKNLASTLDLDTVIVESSNLKASQQWYFTTTPLAGYYRFHTSQKGDAYALDIRGYDGVNTLSIHFHDVDKEGKMVGQYWTIGEWSDGSARISNNFTGTDVLLDVEQQDGGFLAMLANADEKKQGQKWSFGVVGTEASSTASGITTMTTSTMSATGSVASGKTTGTSSPSPSSTAKGGGGGGALGKGPIVGISIAGVAVVAGLIALGVWAWKKHSTSGYEPPSDQFKLPQVRLKN